MRAIVGILVLLLFLSGLPLYVKSNDEKEACLNWEKKFPNVDSKLSLEVSSFHLLLLPPAVAVMQSRRPGEVVAKTLGSYRIANREILVEFDFQTDDPDECATNCKDQSYRANFDSIEEDPYKSCLVSCRKNTEFRYGKDKFRVPLVFRIFKDESSTIRIDGLSYRDPHPIAGKMAYIFPHYFAGDPIGCAPSGISWD
ncbi:hypothetical protein LEP1GSC047_1331 [Leptospira inadai serovar Lyme str. 10]|uniref:Uncharacterized protein n=2 Tax=Leptospira inadai serovar Lyme TaxID=293084 RepID=V6HSD3_9LEPT|nr:hypothetical protein [Leptospira inadai]EQA35504.1 hypothetical protein LEP1GSC047_1331 [Leptospira inadai serovar Lyme str. 10]PNV76053.1 hypothetical protein BES34_006015 [Leptospira inadai serovar Lyme]